MPVAPPPSPAYYAPPQAYYQQPYPPPYAQPPWPPAPVYPQARGPQQPQPVPPYQAAPAYPPAYYPSYPTYPSYPYYTPYYPYAMPQAPPRPPEPRQLRTVQGFDAAVLALYVLGAAFAWAALVGGVAAAGLLPALSGQASLGGTQEGWLNGVLVARVTVWMMFGLAGALSLTAVSRMHEGRLEFGASHERRYREMQATAALFVSLIVGAGVLGYILSSYTPPDPSPLEPADQFAQLRTVQDSIRLGALVWAGAAAVSGMLFAGSFVRLLREFVAPEKRRALAVVPVVLLFVPILHAALAISFVGLAAIDTGTWTPAALHGAAEAGGMAGLAAAVPLIVLARSLRNARERVLKGDVKSESAKLPAESAKLPAEPAKPLA